MGDRLWDRLFSASSALWSLVGLATIALVRAWSHIMGRNNERLRDAAAERAGDFDRLRGEVARLSERVELLERKLAERDTKIAERDAEVDRWRVRATIAEAEVMRLEAYQQGIGEAKQTAQRILSTERNDEDDGE